MAHNNAHAKGEGSGVGIVVWPRVNTAGNGNTIVVWPRRVEVISMSQSVDKGVRGGTTMTFHVRTKPNAPSAKPSPSLGNLAPSSFQRTAGNGNFVVIWPIIKSGGGGVDGNGNVIVVWPKGYVITIDKPKVQRSAGNGVTIVVWTMHARPKRDSKAG